MDSQKIEDLLNLALNTSEEERERSLELNVGYDQTTRSWELIVKYHDRLNEALSELSSLPEGGQIRVEELIAGYAILTVPSSLIDRLAQIEEIEYIEKPKRLFYDIYQGKLASCLIPGGQLASSLRGENVLVAVIDSGIAYRNSNFRNPDGSTRIRYLWDQTLNPAAVQMNLENAILTNLVEIGNDLTNTENITYAPPEGFAEGIEFSKEQIDIALAASNAIAGNLIVPSIDTSGHGTAVAGIAAGNGGEYGEAYAGVAPESELLIVKLGNPDPDSFPRTTELMRALTYVVNKSVALQRPVAINLSFGNTYGAHNGTSLLERFIDNISEIGRSVICVGSGNEGAAGGHTAGQMQESETVSVELIVGNYESGLNVQLWKEYVDRYRVSLRSPSGEVLTVDTDRPGKQVYELEQTKILLYLGEPAPYLTNQEIYFDFLPEEGNRYINGGVWTFTLDAIETVTGNYTFYLPSAAVRSGQTRFVRPTPDITLTIPSTALKVITVGAYQTALESYADFSGRGYLYQAQLGNRTEGAFVKPDLTAPGVGILAPDRDGGYSPVSGTSFATPFVTGAAALLMQWGIVRGNDPYLYGEKVKAYLRKGAKPIRGEGSYPNDKVGYGALCISESLPT